MSTAFTRFASRLAAATLLPICSGALAENPKIRPDEAALLPAWCRVIDHAVAPELRKPESPDTAVKLATLKKSGCDGAWHYCWSLVWGNRAVFGEDGVKPNADRQAHFYGRAADDFNYVLNHSRGSCSLGPDIHAKLGETYTQLGDAKKAEENFRKSLAKKPGYAAAYIGLSDLYENLGDTAKSIAILKEGIAANPKSSSLKKKLQRVEARSAATPQP